MRELDRVLDLWTTLQNAGQPAVLATVVKTQGSSYRLPGARLLLAPDGRYAGTISGGCLEEEILRKAWWLTSNGPIVRKYDTTYDTAADGEIANEGYGLGCSGLIHVLLERVAPSENAVLPLLDQVREQRRPAAVAHLLHPASLIGQRAIAGVDGAVAHNLGDAGFASEVRSELAICQAEGGSKLVRLSGEIEIFFEILTPPIHLLVFGAGNDAIPLTQLGKYLGWRVSVFDGRAHYAKSEKFPDADEVAMRELGSPAPPIDLWTVAVVMTHSYSQDRDVLEALSAKSLAYLGLLGPRTRTARLLTDAGLETVPSLHTPVGLDLGADGPEQVALAIVAEIQSVLNGRTGGMLRDHNGPIHSGENGDRSGREAKLPRVHSIVCA